MSKKKKKTKIHKGVYRLVIIILALLIAYVAYLKIYKVSSIKDIFEGVETKEAKLTEYIVYGTHLNIKGNLEIDSANIDKVSLAFKTINTENQEEFPMTYTKTQNGIEFSTSDLINEGINLEEMALNTYYFFVKVDYNNGTSSYYSLKNDTDYDYKDDENLEYYTITKNEKNNKIDIKFANYDMSGTEIEYMYMGVGYIKLPDNVYDVVIDPGHGGADVGAENGKYNEAELTLEIAEKVKEELEDLGLKVLMTRDGTEGNEYNVYSVYDNNGRVNVTGDSKAKYVFSIHLNSIEQANSQSGVEIYAPAKVNLNFAKSLADNIVKSADTKYSGLQMNYTVDEGVYVRTLTEEDIESSRKGAIAKGYEPYDIKENTPYLYMIRETGGIATGAYVDGRNTSYGVNKYYDSNIGVEAYLLELGYINNRIDLENIVNNQEGYVEGVVKAIKDELLGEDYVAPIKKDDKDKTNTNTKRN